MSAAQLAFIQNHPGRIKEATRSVIASWPRSLRFYLALHALWIALYAFLGKGFAYAGWHPLYAGEFLLLVALPVGVFSRRSAQVLRTPVGVVLSMFFTWQIACTVPYLDRFGVDTLRDSVIWAYGTFALVIATLVIRLPGFPDVGVIRYRRFAGAYLIIGPIACLMTFYLRDWLPRWPGTSVSIPFVKIGEYSVHLAGVLAFALLGLARNKRWWLPVLVLAASLTFTGRGGLLALLVAGALASAMRPRLPAFFVLCICVAILVVSMAVFELSIPVPGTVREISLDQLSVNLQSLVTNSDSQNLEGTKKWRLAWWRTIVNYTLYGEAFWTGKGYGINLADSDGFQVGTREEPLRSPHNSHLTFLARSGVPGFSLWLLLQATWVIQLLRSLWKARKFGEDYWAAIFAWTLAYWTAFVVSASFDVFLEGPMAGIPFWTLFGFGWGCQILFKYRVNWRSAPEGMPLCPSH